MKPSAVQGYLAGCWRQVTTGPGFRGQSVLAVIILGLAVGCSNLPVIQLPFLTPAATSTQPAADSTATPELTLPALPTPIPLPPDQLTLWLPPDFDPAGDNPAAKLLRQRLDQFQTANQVRVDVRLKADSGPSSLLESLASASAAAPLAMPAVVALPRPDMESAALKGLLVPLDGLSNAIDDPDWYDYARELALVQGVTFGLPFAGDSLVLAYRPTRVTSPVGNWEEILQIHQPLGFSAASPSALATIALYQSLGGEVEDAQRRPILEKEKLTEVLDLYRQGVVNGLFPAETTQYETDTQVWQAYKNGSIDAGLTWTSSFLQDRLADSMLAPLPELSDQPSTIATGWVWAVADPLPERQALSARLVEWLSDPAFLAKWSEAAGVLPTRPSAMAAWQDKSIKKLLEQVSVSARARPSTELIASLGPVLEEAVVNVINLQAEPVQAADQAVERLTNPQTR